MPKEDDRKLEPQPETTLFPLSMASTLRATQYMKVVFHVGMTKKWSDSTEIEGWLDPHRFQIDFPPSQIDFPQRPQTREVLYRTPGTSSHGLYTESIRNRYTLNEQAQRFYTFGLGIVGESVEDECDRMKIPLPLVSPADMGRYVRFRKDLLLKNGRIVNNKDRKKLEKTLEERLVKDDAALMIPIDELLHIQGPQVTLTIEDPKSRIAFLLGLMDGYYPLLYSYEWGKLGEASH